MTNLTRLPVEDGFETTLAQAWNWGTGTVYLNDTPVATLGSNTTCIVVDPGKSTMQVAEINAIDTALDTVTVSSTSIRKATGTNYSQVTHASWSVVIISDNYQFWQDIQTAINSKLDSTGGNQTTTFDLDLTGSAWRLRSDAGIMKLTDDQQAEVSLKTLADAAWVNDKTKVSSADTTTGYLNTKLTVSAPITKAITSPAGDERLNLSHDFTNTTYYVSTSAWAGDSGKIVLLNASGQIPTWFLPTPVALRVKICQHAAYDTSTASGTLVITHNLGYTPTTIDFTCQHLSADNTVSWGSWDGTNNMCQVKDTAAGTSILGTDYCGRSSTTGNYASFVVTSVTTTQMTLTITKVASAGWNMSIQAIVRAVA